MQNVNFHIVIKRSLLDVIELCIIYIYIVHTMLSYMMHIYGILLIGSVYIIFMVGKKYKLASQS